MPSPPEARAAQQNGVAGENDLELLLVGLAFWTVLASCVAWYWPALSGPLLLDDHINLRPLLDLYRGRAAWSDVLDSNYSGPTGRPISVATFIGNMLLSGDVFALKYTNLIIHLLCGSLLFWLSGRLLQQTAFRHRWMLALWVATIWLFSPMLVSTTMYVIQRMAQLSALFTLCGLVSYVIGRQSVSDKPKTAAFLILSTFVFWTPLAGFSKENGFLLPLLALTVEWFFFGLRGIPAVQHKLKVLFTAFVGVPAAAGIILFLLRPEIVMHGYIYRDFSLLERVLTETRVLFSYVRQLLLPSGSSLGLYHDDYPISSSFLSPPTTLPAVLGWISIVMVGTRIRAFKLRLLFFGPIFFLSAHAMESSIFPLEIYFEHRNYLPAAGLFLSLAVGLYFLLDAVRAKKTIGVLLVFLTAVYIAAGYQRVLAWRNFDTVVLIAEHSHPASKRLHSDLAIYYMAHGDFDRAFHHLDRLEALHGNKIPTGVLLQRIATHCVARSHVPNDVYRRLESFDRYTDDPYTLATLDFIGTRVQNGQCPTLDLNRFIAIVKNWLDHASRSANVPRMWKLKIILASLMGTAGQVDEAVSQLDDATRLWPERLEPEMIKLQVQVANGRLMAAFQTLQHVKGRDRGDRRNITNTIAEYERWFRKNGFHETKGRSPRPVFGTGDG